MSIARAQAEALASGFLDSLGEVKSFKPKTTVTEVVLLAATLIEEAQSNLNKSNANASGNLSASLQIGEPQINGSVFQVDIYMNHYGQFLNKGVKGTKSGSGLYAFKHDYPSKGMIDALREWIKQGKLKTRNTNKQKTISRNEKKNASISEIDNVFALARSIKQHGIKPTGFLDKAIATTKQKVKDRLGKALQIDVIDSLTR